MRHGPHAQKPVRTTGRVFRGLAVEFSGVVSPTTVRRERPRQNRALCPAFAAQVAL